MTGVGAQLLRALDAAPAVVWLHITRTQGSAPRDAGAGMWVSLDAAGGTIGGGHLEQVACDLARSLLRTQETQGRPMLRQFPLGPALGQCCGGRVELLLLPLGPQDRPWLRALAVAEQAGQPFSHGCVLETGESHVLEWRAARWPIAVFGAGHVGRALVTVLSALPCELRWIDSRADAFPQPVADTVDCVESADPAAEVRDLPAGADVVVLTHSHALDFDICVRLLQRDNLGFVGLIGSRTKMAHFGSRLRARGFSPSQIERIQCPIGLPWLNEGPERKHPGVIALSVAAQLTARRQAQGIEGQEFMWRGVRGERSSTVAT